ncbi:MAG TPA: hypothetical protein VMV34_07725 [Terriglobia bacterium]|nr:hypothetical protein [Terriglobia bacterium]
MRAMGGQIRKDAAGAKNPESGERTLIYIPIIHTQADMGALSESIERLKVKRLGRKAWERNVNLVGKLWDQIEQAIESLVLPSERVRLYQDGLPVCGREVEIVAELAKAGSRNHRLLLRLREKGATIMGTESSEFLVEEYQLVKEVFALGKSEVATGGEARRKALRNSLLKRRDQYIARRINDTLLAGETGLIFLGMLHSLGPWLDKDIRVVYPTHQPLNCGEKEP